MTARRWPWVTTSIVALNLIVHVTLLLTANTHELEQVGRRALDFHVAHPKLAAKPPLDRIERALGVKPIPADPHPELSEVLELSGARPAVEDDGVELQAELDALCEELDQALARTPNYRFGYVPAKMSGLGLITHQFLHGGWMHLIFNMWFLWLVGCNIEDGWGRLVFLGFYLVSGVVAAFSHQLSVPTSAVPLIGASGAVAGAMGAFLVKYLKTSIRFWYLVWLVFRPIMGSFSAPAFVILPLWLATQLFWGIFGEGESVAYWAHVGGFAFGVGVALAVRFSGQEKKLDAAIEKQISVSQDPRLLAAGEHIDRGEYDVALRRLDELVREDPNKVELHLERLRAAQGKHDPSLESSAYADAIRAYLQHMPDTALELFEEACHAGRAEKLSRDVLLRFGRLCVTRGSTDRAAEIFSALYAGGAVDAPALNALIAHGELLLARGDGRAAAELFEYAAVAPFPHAELDDYLQQKLKQAWSQTPPRPSVSASRPPLRNA